MTRDIFQPSGRIQFGIFFQGVNSGTIWKAAESGSQTDFESFRHIVQTAERGKFAAFFLGKGCGSANTSGARMPWMSPDGPMPRPCSLLWRP